MKKILVVDDDEDILFIVRHILKSRGFIVKTHSSAIGVFKIIADFNPHLVLLDIMLPGKLGTEICKELKEIKPTLLVILFSANSEKGNAYPVCHADGFISKPFDVKDFVHALNEQFRFKYGQPSVI
ncbi:MAG: response regulator [Ginsengibacter sp.]